WNFDDGSLADTSGNGKTLLVDHGSAEYLANGTGNALNAKGDSFYYDFGNQAQLNHFTISFWAQTQASGWKNYWTLLSTIEQTGTNNDSAGLRFQNVDSSPTGNVRGVTIYNGGSGYNAISNLSTLSVAYDPVWTMPRSDYDHFVFTVNQGAAKLYLNNTQIWSGNWTNTNKIGLFSLAGCYGIDNRDMSAYFDNVSVYNRGLTAAEVGLIHAAGSASTNNFADIYSRKLSGTGDQWSDNVWNHQFGESGTPVENQAWTNYSQVKLSGNGTIDIDQSVFISQMTVTTEMGETLLVNGGLAGDGGVHVTGTGRLVLSGTNTYAGETTVSSRATLQLNGSLENSAVILDENATLMGNGMFSMKSLETSSHSRILFHIDGEGNFDPLQVLETATLGEGVLDFVFDGNFVEILGDSPLDILQATDLVFEKENLLLAESWRGKLDMTLLTVADVGEVLRVSVSDAYVPEPATWVLGLLGLLGGVWLIRKK
ncbi:MAG: hypothetical protein Q4E67_08600, partial [Planctomycetia bacterium]|nr:hypothetical protein [Planctomycetia bacterium]